MKKIIMAVVACVALYASAVTQTYKFTSSIRFPYLNNGVRTYVVTAMKGDLYMSFDEDGTLTNSTLNVQNIKTKAWHKFDFTQSFYHLMGKANKMATHSAPSVAFAYYDNTPTEDLVEAGTEKNAQEPHETIASMYLAGNGSLKYTKTVLKGCGSCGVPTTTVEYCSILQRMSGSLVGVMDCVCPDDEAWKHTVVAGPCGPKPFVDGIDDANDMTSDEEVRTHYASFWGNWTAVYKSTTND